MYYPNAIEEICHEQTHIDEVWSEMSAIIPIYFKQMIDTDGGNAIDESEAIKLSEKFGSSSKPKTKTKNAKNILTRLLKDATTLLWQIKI